MKKKVVSMLLCASMVLTLFAGCGNGQTDNNTPEGNDTQVEGEEDSGEGSTDGEESTDDEGTDDVQNEANEAQEIVLAAADATVTGQGINAESQIVDTVYVSDLHAVTNMGTDSTITYTVSEGVEGNYDIYLDISKSPYAYGTTPVSVIVNGDKEYVRPAAIVSCAPDYSDLFAMGKFLMAENVTLAAGDTLMVHGKAGFEIEYGGNTVSTLSSIGDMYLYPVGTAVAVGYDGGVMPQEEATDASDPLSGKTLVWLGSSVTFGSGGYTMADAIADNHAATKCLKYAISGTTLVNESPSSYVERMKEIDTDMDIDMLIVQLSTNDATTGKPMGSLSDSENLEDFDDTTIIGAIEYIIAYARDTWNCPVVFYTGSYFESQEYGDMVQALLDIQEKWDMGVIDLWNDEEMTALYGSDEYYTYMSEDGIHPLREGYVSWWTPKFEAYLSEFSAQ